MNLMDSFEMSWAERHDIPVESLEQYRHTTQDGYRLPGLASHYRTWCIAIEHAINQMKLENDHDE